MTNKQKIDENGWVLIKNLFSKSEISNLREIVLREQSHIGDLLSNDSLRGVLTDDRIINIFKECLEVKQLYYFGASSISIDSNGYGFHKDSRHREKKDIKELKDKNYSVLRLALYLQDHSTHSRGLILRDKSHLKPGYETGKVVNVKTEIGDVVLWKLTTTHSANAEVISLFPNYSLHPRFARKFPKFLRQKSISPRLAIFICFGIDDDYSKGIIDYLKTRQFAIDRWANSKYSDEAIKQLEKLNVKVYSGFDINELGDVNIDHKPVEIKWQ